MPDYDNTPTLATITEQLDVLVDVVAQLRTELLAVEADPLTRVALEALHDAAIAATRAARGDRSPGCGVRRGAVEPPPF